MIRSDCFVSVVVPIYNDSPIIEHFVAEAMQILHGNYENYELVLVDDGSDDDTVTKIAALLVRYDCIRLIRLSRRFGLEVAITSGLEAVIGDFTVVMLPDSDPPQLIPEIIERARGGHGVVFGVRKDRAGEPVVMRLGVGLFYWVGRTFFKLTIPGNATHFRALSRQAVNAVTQIKEKYRYFRLMSTDIGYIGESFVYEPLKRYGRRRAGGLAEALERAIGIIVSNSTHPLRWVSWLGLVAGGMNALYVGYVVLTYLFKNEVAEGWTTLSLQIACMFFLVFAILAVLSEYVGRTFDESRDRPLYHVLEERHSAVMIADQQRRNVVKDSPRDGHEMAVR